MAAAPVRHAGGTTQNTAIEGATSGTNNGDAGVYGHSSGASGQVAGVYGDTASASGYGVYGTNTGTNGMGVYGVANIGNTAGVFGTTNSTTAGAAAVQGNATSATGATSGVTGYNASATGYGGYFTAASTAAGASALLPGGVSINTRSQPAARARSSSSAKSFSVTNRTTGNGSSCCWLRRLPHDVAFCWLSMSRIMTLRSAAVAAVPRCFVRVVLPTPPLLIAIATVRTVSRHESTLSFGHSCYGDP
jgi:hypothetical protein